MIIKKILNKLNKNPIILEPYIQENVKNKVVIVTGASKGIGLAVTEVLLNQGAKVIGIARNFDQMEKNLSKYLTSKYTLELMKCDITNPDEVSNTIKFVLRKFKKIDVLINNAGIFQEIPIEKVANKQINEIIDTNIKGTIYFCRQVISQMKIQQSGFIINIGSMITKNSHIESNKSLYALTKYAIEGFSNALNHELFPDGIKVTCLLPATVNTFFSRKSKTYLNPYNLGQIICMMISMPNIDFKNLVIKSIKQDL
jgi:3-oxoacyl-[acyl-carrier protein] reductase